MLMAKLDKIGPEKQRISERLMRVEQRRSRSFRCDQTSRD
jgi:hypothetical protein